MKPSICSYNSHAVRTISINSEPHFSALDIAKIIEVVNIHSRISKFTSDEKSAHRIPTRSGNQEMMVLSVSGMNRLLDTCSKPKVKPVRKWLTFEVLPDFYQKRQPVTLLLQLAQMVIDQQRESDRC
jgi:anti-repressor protein